MARRGTTLALLAIVLIATIRGLFWIVATPVWIKDEGPDFSYVQSIATGHGFPVTGRDSLSPQTLALLKGAPGAPQAAEPLRPDEPAPWGLTGAQYEGYQTPLFYVMGVPAYWLGRIADGTLGAFYALRFFALLLSLAGLLLAHALARRLLPDRPAVAVLATALLASLQIMNGQGSLLDNDCLTLAAGSVVLLVVFRTVRAPSWRSGVGFGAAGGLALLSKGDLVGLAPAVLIVIVVYAVRHGLRGRVAMAWAAGAAAAGLIVLLPWLVFNEAAYGGLSGGRSEAALLIPVIGRTPVTPGGFWRLLSYVRRSLFVTQVPAAGTATLREFWTVVVVVGVAAAVGGALLHRSRRDLELTGWIVLSCLAGTAVVIVGDMTQSGEGALVFGRHLDCLLPLVAILVADATLRVLGGRVGPVALLGLCVAGAFVEAGPDRAWVALGFTNGIVGSSVPVVEQPFADRAGPVAAIDATSHCPVTHVEIVQAQDPPTGLSVNGTTAMILSGGSPWTTYAVAAPVTGALHITLARPSLLSITPAPRVSGPGSVVAEGGFTPALRLYCVVAQPAAARFSETFDTYGLLPLSYDQLRDWPVGEAWAEFALWLLGSGGWLLLCLRYHGICEGRHQAGPGRTTRSASSPLCP